MNTVKVRNIEIGTGIPKVCVPIVGVTREEILVQASAINNIHCDLVEWRIDWYDSVNDNNAVLDLLRKLRAVLCDTPILVTFRTKAEGGAKEISAEEYKALNIAAAQSGNADLIDVELFSGDDLVQEVIHAAHQNGVKVIASSHDFSKTPDQKEIVHRLCRMQELNADICKIAVMPRNKRDVLTLLSATEEMTSEHADRPVITMSMSADGVISRLCGEVFGSALTFGSAGKASAPGQMGVDDLNTVLQLIHKAL